MTAAAPRLFCFGLGYTALALAETLRARGWRSAGTCREAGKRRQLADLGIEALPFDRDRPLGCPAEALAAIMENGTGRHPDVILSDIGMPGEDGLALIAGLRAIEQGAAKDIPAIALTAYATAEDRERTLGAGFQMHIAKPFDPIELVNAIAGIAGRNGKLEDAT